MKNALLARVQLLSPVVGILLSMAGGIALQARRLLHQRPESFVGFVAALTN